MSKALATTLLLAAAYSSACTAGVAWSEYPGYYSPGGHGIVVADVDGDGTQEAIVTGSAEGFGPSSRRFLAVLKYSPANGYRTTYMRVLDDGEQFIGGIFAAPGTSGAGARIVATLEGPGASRYLTTFSGATLDRISSIDVGSFTAHGIADVDADGTLEAFGVAPAFSWNDGPVQVRNLATGEIEWSDVRLAYRVAAGQLDQDPQLELVYGTNQSSDMGYVVDGLTHMADWLWAPGFRGTPVFGNFDNNPATKEFAVIEPWGVTRIYVSVPFYSPLSEFNTGQIQAVAVRDLNADGIDELMVGEGQWGRILAYNTTNWSVALSYLNPEHGVSAIGIGNLDGDSNLEVVYGAGLTHSGKDLLTVFDAATNTTEYAKADEGGPHSVHALVDLDGNGSEEIIYTTIQTNSGYSGPKLAILDAETGVELNAINNVAGSFASAGVQVRVANMDADSALEIVVARERISIYDGETLALQWTSSNNQFTINSMELVELTGDGVPDIFAAVGGQVRIMDGATGQLLWSTITYGQTFEPKLAVGNVDADSALEIILIVNGSAYVIDTQTRLTQLSYSSGSTVGLAIEGAGEACRIVHYGADQVARRSCATGAVQSTRTLVMNNATMVQPATDSYGILAVSDGERMVLQQGEREVGLPVTDLGPSFGWSNKAAIANDGGRVILFAGNQVAVHRLEVDGELVFSNGFGD